MLFPLNRARTADRAWRGAASSQTLARSVLSLPDSRVPPPTGRPLTRAELGYAQHLALRRVVKVWLAHQVRRDRLPL